MQLKEFGSVNLVYMRDKGLSRGIRNQESEVRSQKSGESRDRKSRISKSGNHEPETMNHEPETRDQRGKGFRDSKLNI